ncbi:MAG: glucose-1-phosphate adenylyltransferase subunit GlgD [Lachnospiraceae bacterium]|nr:glucose-1-phosphate adenylyltransferase subunit GlgD [Lachnospiraceae bacterium]
MKAVGIILAGGNHKRMRELSQTRAIAALPVAGTYRSVDFALSNMTNSGINRVAVVTQYNAKSLNAHLNSSKWWNFGRKQGGLYVFNPILTADNNSWFRGTADSICQNIDFLKESHEPYVVIASGDCIYKLDYDQVLQYHIDRRADITIVCKNMGEMTGLERFGLVSTDGENRVMELEEKPVEAKSNIVSCGIYIIRRRLLIELLEQAASEERYDFVKDILVRYRRQKKIYAYLLDSYWSNISSIEAYFNTNMDFLRKDIRDYFFKEGEPIFSKVDDLPPAKFNYGSQVKNSLIATGSIINGHVENSVIFKEGFIGNNCIIRNSIILNDVYIRDNSVIENCIVESHSTIEDGSVFKGEEGNPRIVIEKNERYNYK